jgi:Immune inhibitor A peptidase M6
MVHNTSNHKQDSLPTLVTTSKDTSSMIPGNVPHVPSMMGLLTNKSAASMRPLFLLFALSSQVQAWIPPKPGSGVIWEPVVAMRQRLGLEFNFTPALLHPETCRYLTVEECQAADENLIDHAKHHRALQEVRRTNPNLGSFKVLVLLIVFGDHVDRPRIAKADVENMWKTLVPEWFDVNSHGLYDIDPVVTEWVVTDNTEKYYSFGKRGVVPDFQKAAWPALDALDKRSDWDWSIFDLDKDGKLDSVMITHSGYGAESMGADEHGTDYMNRIWAHAFSSSTASAAWTSQDGSVQLNGYTVASAFEGVTGAVPATIGLTVHEYMHTFGLPVSAMQLVERLLLHVGRAHAFSSLAILGFVRYNQSG